MGKRLLWQSFNATHVKDMPTTCQKLSNTCRVHSKNRKMCFKRHQKHIHTIPKLVKTMPSFQFMLKPSSLTPCPPVFPSHPIPLTHHLQPHHPLRHPISDQFRLCLKSLFFEISCIGMPFLISTFMKQTRAIVMICCTPTGSSVLWQMPHF